MEVIVVLGFMLIPLFGAAMYAAYVLVPALIINLLLVRYLTAFKIVQILSFLALVVLFFYLSQGEVGRNLAFQIIFIISFLACYFVYLWLCKKLIKSNLKKHFKQQA